eukprot:771065-Pelagomonas_calceolata.AAC.2
MTGSSEELVSLCPPLPERIAVSSCCCIFGSSSTSRLLQRHLVHLLRTQDRVGKSYKNEPAFEGSSSEAEGCLWPNLTDLEDFRSNSRNPQSRPESEMQRVAPWGYGDVSGSSSAICQARGKKMKRQEGGKRCASGLEVEPESS